MLMQLARHAYDVKFITKIFSKPVTPNLTIYIRHTPRHQVKPGFHYPSWRPELTTRVDGWPVSITRQHGPLARAVNSGSGNRALDLLKYRLKTRVTLHFTTTNNNQ